MVDSINGQGGLARSAIEAALERRNTGIREMQEKLAQLQGTQTQDNKAPAFLDALKEGIQKADKTVRAVDALPERVLRGEVELHEAAAQIQMSRISFEFTMELRNKFIDAYREIMRMSV
ncbi:MAG: flagellar hook-basal body complex protein FliE [Planctomycetota bacterium]|jgi:flagellar hook-basal body complex protein FliE